MKGGALNYRKFVFLPVAMLLSSGISHAQDNQSPSPSAPVAAVDRGATVSLAPLRIELDGAERAATLRVFNPSARAIGVQVRTFGWKQESGQDVYFPANNVMISPSIITIDPGETQIFRIVRKEQPATSEQRFRVAVDQLPDPELLRSGEAQARIRFTIPMFFDRALAAPAKLAWSLGESGLNVQNAGGQTARLVNLSIISAQGQPVPLELGGLHYVQGGSALNWPLTGPCPSGPLTIKATVEGEEISAQVANTCG